MNNVGVSQDDFAPQALKAGNEVYFELFDDDQLTAAEADKIKRLISSGIIVIHDGLQMWSVKSWGEFSRSVGEVIVDFNQKDWDFIGKATLAIPDTPVPAESFANPVSIIGGGSEKGTVTMFQVR